MGKRAASERSKEEKKRFNFYHKSFCTTNLWRENFIEVWKMFTKTPAYDLVLSILSSASNHFVC